MIISPSVFVEFINKKARTLKIVLTLKVGLCLFAAPLWEAAKL
jgi:hypothetical protein